MNARHRLTRALAAAALALCIGQAQAAQKLRIAGNFPVNHTSTAVMN